MLDTIALLQLPNDLPRFRQQVDRFASIEYFGFGEDKLGLYLAISIKDALLHWLFAIPTVKPSRVKYLCTHVRCSARKHPADACHSQRNDDGVDRVGHNRCRRMRQVSLWKMQGHEPIIPATLSPTCSPLALNAAAISCTRVCSSRKLYDLTNPSSPAAMTATPSSLRRRMFSA